MVRNVILGMGLLVLSLAGAHGADNKKASSPSSRIVVYYLHNTWRCPGCNSVESLSRAAVLGGRGENTKTGTFIQVPPLFATLTERQYLSYLSVNIDLPENKALLGALGKQTKVPVIATIEDGKITSFLPLGDAWRHLGDNAAMISYVQKGVAAVVPTIPATKVP